MYMHSKCNGMKMKKKSSYCQKMFVYMKANLVSVSTDEKHEKKAEKMWTNDWWTYLNKPYFGELMKPVNDKFLFFSVKYCFLLLLQFFFWSSLYGRFQIGVSQPIYAIKSSTCFSSCNQSINLINNLFVFQLIEIRKLKLMFINKPLVNPPLEHNGYTMRMHFSAYVLHWSTDG